MTPSLKMKFFLFGSILFSLSFISFGELNERKESEAQERVKDLSFDGATKKEGQIPGKVLPLGFDAVFDIDERDSLGHAEDRLKSPTPSQPKGPFYPETYPDDTDADLTYIDGGEEEALGVKVYIHGKVMNPQGEGLGNAVVEIWQACQSGKYDHPRDDNNALADPNFQYYASIRTKSDGSYAFKTIVPGPYPAHSGWWRPPHVHFLVQKEGYKQLITQLYFSGKSFPETIAIIRGKKIDGKVIDSLNELDWHIGKSSEETQKKLITEFHPVEGKEEKVGTFDIYLEKNKRSILEP